jgi:hypothetical protein
LPSARPALRHGAQATLDRRKGCEVLSAAQVGRGAGEDDGAAPTRQHGFGSFAPAQEAGKASHFPDLGNDSGGPRLDLEARVSPDVEHHDPQRTDVSLNIFEQCEGFLF